jgi:hypothetical protein
LTPREMAYDIGCNDAGLPESERYQLEGRTDEFVSGYYSGYYECGGDISPTDRGFAPWENTSPNTEDNPVAAPSDSKESNASEISPYDMGRDMGCNDASSGLPYSSELAGHTADFVEGY